MELLSAIITRFIDILLVPFGHGRQTLELVYLSVLTGLGMAYVFKITSNQLAIKKAKDKLKARILEMRIYQDDLVLIVKALGGSLKRNLVYLGTMFRPILVLIVPVVIIFMQLDERHGRRALEPGSETVLTVQMKEGVDVYGANVRLQLPDGVALESKPVRVASLREVSWPLRIEEQGVHEIAVHASGNTYTFPLVADPQTRMVGHTRTASSFVEPLLHPALSPIPKDSPFRQVRMRYPGARYPLFGWDVHWIVIFLVYSLLGAIVLKFLLGIEV